MLAWARGAPATDGDGGGLASRVLVIALPDDDGVQKVPESIGISEGTDSGAMFHRPESDLNFTARRSAISPSETVTVLRPQLGCTVLLGDVVAVTHRF
jgi:hypothetical protein